MVNSMPSDNRNNPPKPNKDQKVSDLPQKKADATRDEKVKGGKLSPEALDSM